ncbi:MAG: hypothetical protein PUC45_05375 [Oscillospiraceae bacterium]|nr:hypothetical protein [Oscillospiraceae bacterium]
MYNRYIRNDNGNYARIPQEEPKRTAPGTPPQRETPKQHPPPNQMPEHTAPPFEPSPHGDPLSGFLRNFLDQFHLDHVDTGDLLLLGLLFLLFREDADEELLVALGLLLIL